MLNLICDVCTGWKSADLWFDDSRLGMHFSQGASVCLAECVCVSVFIKPLSVCMFRCSYDTHVHAHRREHKYIKMHALFEGPCAFMCSGMCASSSGPHFRQLLSHWVTRRQEEPAVGREIIWKSPGKIKQKQKARTQKSYLLFISLQFSNVKGFKSFTWKHSEGLRRSQSVPERSREQQEALTQLAHTFEHIPFVIFRPSTLDMCASKRLPAHLGPKSSNR